MVVTSFANGPYCRSWQHHHTNPACANCYKRTEKKVGREAATGRSDSGSTGSLGVIVYRYT